MVSFRPPVGVAVSIDNPADGLVTGASEITVSGTLGADIASVKVNDVSASVTGGGFTATVPLREGTHMVVALATKSNGNTGTSWSWIGTAI